MREFERHTVLHDAEAQDVLGADAHVLGGAVALNAHPECVRVHPKLHVRLHLLAVDLIGLVGESNREG